MHTHTHTHLKPRKESIAFVSSCFCRQIDSHWSRRRPPVFVTQFVMFRYDLDDLYIELLIFVYYKINSHWLRRRPPAFVTQCVTLRYYVDHLYIEFVICFI